MIQIGYNHVKMTGMLHITHSKIHESSHRSYVNARMLTGQQLYSKIPTLQGNRISTDRQCKSKGGQAMKFLTSLPPLFFYCRSVQERPN